jgi:hypothetical protein
MNPDRWQRLEDLFHATLERPPAEREAFLTKACAGDQELRKDVERLLRADEEASAFVDSAAAGVERLAATVLPDGRQVGGYRIVRQLGRGGMGSVYLGERADAQLMSGRSSARLMRRATCSFSRTTRIALISDAVTWPVRITHLRTRWQKGRRHRTSLGGRRRGDPRRYAGQSARRAVR